MQKRMGEKVNKFQRIMARSESESESIAAHLLFYALQAHADALGSWGDNGAVARRAWEGDGRIDLRSVTNCLRQLPYHVAWQRGFRQAAGVLNPTVPIDSALETCRELGEGMSCFPTCCMHCHNVWHIYSRVAKSYCSISCAL